LRDDLREFFEAPDRLSDGTVDDLVDRLEIPGEMRSLLILREIDKQVEGRRQCHRAIRPTDLDGLDDPRHSDLIQSKSVRDPLTLDVLRD
jgi:hypothetical protein